MICAMNINENGRVSNIDEFLENIDNFDAKKIKDR